MEIFKVYIMAQIHGSTGTTEVTKIINMIIGTVQVVGVFVAIAFLIFIGIKYMVAAKKYLPEAPYFGWSYILSDYSENHTLTLPGVPDGITATSSEQKAINAIYDLSGRKLTEKPQKGFYIQGGRKYIAR